jgi:hypothetical protein
VIGGAGSVDDYAKIILCLSASSGRGKIWFPEGIYNLSQPLDIPVSNLDIDGSTQAFITAKTGGAFTSASDNWVFRINGLSNIKIRNICFDGNKSGNPTGRTFGVDVQGNCTNILFENVSFLNCPGSTSAGVLGGDGCRVGQTGYTPKNINFLECDFDGNVRTGLGLITGEGILVDGCTIRNTTGDNLGVGVDIEPDPSGTPTLRNVRVNGCWIYDNAGGGISVVYNNAVSMDMAGISITANSIYSNGSTSSTFGQIFVNGHRQGLIIAGNNVTVDYNCGVSLIGAASVQITGNNFTGAYSANEDKCIRMYTNSGGEINNISIVGNSFYKTGQSAIFLDSNLAGSGNIQGISIVGNTFRDCVKASLIASTPVVWLFGDATRDIRYVTITGNSFLDTRGGGAANYAIGINGAVVESAASLATNAIIGNAVTGFGAGVPYSGSASAFIIAPTSMNAGRMLVTDANKSIGTPSTAPYWDAANQYLGIGAAGARNLDIQVANSGGQISARIANTSNSAGASAAVQIESGGALTKESSITQTYTGLSSGSRWTFGRYHSNGHWILAQNSDLSSTSKYAIDVDASQNVEISVGNLTVAKENIVLGTAGKGITYQAGPKDLSGSGSPEGVVTAPVGSTYRRSDGGIGSSLYIKEIGSGNTGWIQDAGGIVSQTFSNANVTISNGVTFCAQTGTMSASRTVTLPSASAYPRGTRISIVDESGTTTAANTLVITRAGSDTINGATTKTIGIVGGYDVCVLVSDGISKWTVLSSI